MVGLNTGSVNGSGSAGGAIFSFEERTSTGIAGGANWLLGRLPRNLYYPASHPATQDMRRSKVVQNLRKEFISGGCVAPRTLDSGHFGPWAESAKNGIIGNTTQFQVGGFDLNVANSRDGAVTNFTITNEMGLSSLLGQTTLGYGLRKGALDNIIVRNVRQSFSWTEPNPCH